MPTGATEFRAVCGSFLPVFLNFMMKRVKKYAAMRIAILHLRKKLHGAVLGLLLSYIFWGSLLLQCGDVESNPGPNQSQRSRRASVGTASTRSSAEKSGHSRESTTNQVAEEPSLSDILHKLDRMETKFEELRKEVHDVSEANAALHEEMKGLWQEVSSLRQQNQDLRQKNEELTEKLEDLTRKTDDLEGRSKRNNLIFYGMPRKEGETPEDCENILKDLITSKLELSEEVEFDRVHRLNSKPDSPIIGRCVFYKQKISVLKAKPKLQGTNIFVGEDFSMRVRDIRKKLNPHLKKARNDGKRATLVFNYLLIDGKRFTVDGDDKLTELK